MAEVQPVSVCDNNSTYSAVKIRVNNPKTIINDCCAPNIKAVDIEVNNPQAIYDKNFYQYPQASNPVMYENLYPNQVMIPNQAMIPSQTIMPNVPVLPVAYQTNIIQSGTENAKEISPEKQKEINEAKSIAQNIINSLNAIKAAELRRGNQDKMSVVNSVSMETPVQETDTKVVVPEPNITTVEAEKSEKPDFKIAESTSENAVKEEANVNITETENVSNSDVQPAKEIEIVPPVDILPEVDITQVVQNLRSEDYDVALKQMKDIGDAYSVNPEKVIPYITVDVFDALIDIADIDTTELEQADNRQIEIRGKIVENKIAENLAIRENKNPSEIELPYNISDEDYQYAIKLAPAEKAERNRRVALNTITLLAKEYSDKIKENTGNIIPLTEIPGISALTDTLRYENSSRTKIIALANLEYLYRPEYKDDYKSLLEIVANDKDADVAQYASEMLRNLA